MAEGGWEDDVTEKASNLLADQSVRIYSPNLNRVGIDFLKRGTIKGERPLASRGRVSWCPGGPNPVRTSP